MLNKTFSSGLFLALVLIVFIVLKIDYLNDPLFWDEIGVYGKGIFQMADGKPSLHPKALPPHISRGHPLFYSFYHATIIKLVGKSLFNLRLSNLLFSLLLPILFFYFLRKNISRDAAIIAVLFLLIQPVYFVQSTMVLPEIMLTLLLCTATILFVSRKYIQCSVFFCLAVLTKETALPIPIILATYEIILFYVQNKSISLKKIVLLKMIYIIPYSLFGIFILIQKKINGWFIFPFHSSLLTTDLNIIATRFFDYSKFVFIDQGRIYLSTITLLLLGIVTITNKAYQLKKTYRLFTILLITSFLLIMIYSINFYMNRYIVMCVISHIIICSIIWSYAIKTLLIKNILKVVLFIIFIIQIKHSNSHEFKYDEDLSFRSILKLQEFASQEIEDASLIDKNRVYCNFPLSYSFNDHRYGFVRKDYQIGSLGILGPETEYAYIIHPPGPGSPFSPDRETHLIKTIRYDYAKLEVWEICK